MKTELSALPKARALEAPQDDGRLVLSVATESDRETIYRLRHEVYARELCQHASNRAGNLSDALDAANTYLVVNFPV